MDQVNQKMKEIYNKTLEKLEFLNNMHRHVRQIDTATVATAQDELNAVVNTVKKQCQD